MGLWQKVVYSNVYMVPTGLFQTILIFVSMWFLVAVAIVEA